jgi:hypothetical protein
MQRGIVRRRRGSAAVRPRCGRPAERTPRPCVQPKEQQLCFAEQEDNSGLFRKNRTLFFARTGACARGDRLEDAGNEQEVRLFASRRRCTAAAPSRRRRRPEAAANQGFSPKGSERCFAAQRIFSREQRRFPTGTAKCRAGERVEPREGAPRTACRPRASMGACRSRTNPNDRLPAATLGRV